LKKYLTSVAAIAIAASCAGAALAADDTATVNGITFYGIVDVGMTYDTHGVPSSNVGSVGSYYLIQPASNKAMFSAAQSGMSQSRWGIKGATDIGEGWTGIFRLEGGINPMGGAVTDGIRSVVNCNGEVLAQRTACADSSQDGGLFDRAAYAGVSNGTYGTLTFGRHTTLEADTIAVYDPLYNAYAFSLIGFSGTTAGSGRTQDARWDNSVKYLGAYGPVRVGLMYQFGGTITRDDTGVGADVGFDYGPVSFDATYTHKKDEVSASPLSAAQMITASAAGFNPQNSFSATISDNTAYGINAKYTWEQFKFMGGYEYIVYTNPSSPLAAGFLDIGNYIGAVVNNQGNVAATAASSTYANHNITQVSWVGLRYMATPKLELMSAWYHIDQNAFATGANTGCNDTRATNCSGSENVFSLAADYHFTKKLDVYAGAMYSQFLNGLASGALHNNNIDPTIGVRYSW
jgi:predicted porin